jgi:predicted GNAT superfamily acetyltransferase
MIRAAGVGDAAASRAAGADAVARARAAAAAAAGAAGVEIVETSRYADLVGLRELFDTVWSPDPTTPVVTPELLIAYRHTGQYVVKALDTTVPGQPMIAGSVAFLGAPIGRALHSHVTGVLSPGRGRGLGYAVKLHQRAWALERGLDLVTWTFDPLIRRNAWFNLAKLGARPTEYLVNFYGEIHDDVNVGDESDRLFLAWPLDDPGVERACAGESLDVPIDRLRDDGAVTLLSVAADGSPRQSAADGDVALVQVPPDIEAMRHQEPALARRWRAALREVLTGARTEGRWISGIGRGGWYVLRRQAQEPVEGAG